MFFSTVRYYAPPATATTVEVAAVALFICFLVLHYPLLPDQIIHLWEEGAAVRSTRPACPTRDFFFRLNEVMQFSVMYCSLLFAARRRTYFLFGAMLVTSRVAIFRQSSPTGLYSRYSISFIQVLLYYYFEVYKLRFRSILILLLQLRQCYNIAWPLSLAYADYSKVSRMAWVASSVEWQRITTNSLFFSVRNARSCFLVFFFL